MVFPDLNGLEENNSVATQTRRNKISRQIFLQWKLLLCEFFENVKKKVLAHCKLTKIKEGSLLINRKVSTFTHIS